jgi:phosphoribosylformimino-5-aminoimidazole carboxamide ribotide isomerase
MQVIPVIDIRNGAVVRAVAGRRSEYRPLRSPLASTSAPLDVAGGLMSLHPFSKLYIADLDAIEGRSANFEAINGISAAFAQARLWVDAGLKSLTDAKPFHSMANVDVVIGSESFTDLRALRTRAPDSRIVLSLDFSETGFLGDAEILRDASMWSEEIIVMTLARVGADQGPDHAWFNEILSRAEGKNVYAAGGVRGLEDLLALRQAGAAGALVATALHDGRLPSAALSRFCK